MKLIEEFVNNWLNFYLDINDKKGIDEEKLELLERSLFSLKEECSPKGHIPLKVGNIFIDLYSSLESSSYLYPEAEQKEILYTAEYLASLARDVCLNPKIICKDPIINSFENNIFNLYISIRKREGLKSEILSKTIDSLFDLKNKFNVQGYIPLEVGNIFIDLYSSLESSSYLYPESEQKEILYTAEYLASLARDVCSN